MDGDEGEQGMLEHLETYIIWPDGLVVGNGADDLTYTHQQ